MRHYRSRYTSAEEKKNTRKALGFIVLAAIFLGVFLFIGLPAVGKLMGFVSDLKRGNVTSPSYDKTPPAPPFFDLTPEAVNKSNFDLTGKTEEGATITISFNDVTEDIIANSSGEFTYNANLVKGENTFWAIAKDESGNESVKSKIVTVRFDNEPPKLNILTPGDGASYYGSSQKDLSITGETEPEVTLTVNERYVGVDAEGGTFSYSYPLSEGENKLEFKAVDKAGNETVKSLTINFTN